MSSSPIRFGVFEADLLSGELRRRGAKVKLQEQPFQVLAALLQRPGQVVTRNELQQKIWAADTFVDYERGLNKAINRLRDALGDSTKSPSFIETLPRKGYRFIARVEQKIGSLAVLPFDNLSADPTRDYWADGMTDEVITQLAKLSGLRVISRTSVMCFKGSRMPMREIAWQLGVDAVVEGSVAVAGQKIRIRVQLVNAASEQHLWAESFERELRDIVALHAEIAHEIASQVRTRLMAGNEARLPNARTVKPAAYEAYLKGRFFWNKRTEADLNKSIQYFEQSIALDPDCGLAFAGLADAYVLLGIFGLSPPKDVYPKAKAAAARALQLDETLAEAHTSLADCLKCYDWDWQGAEREYKRALQLNPNYSIAHQWYGQLLMVLQRFEEGINEVERARDLDPLSLPISAFVGFAYMKAKQYGPAIEACRKAIELDPNNPFGHYNLARVLDAQNELQESLAEAKKAASLSRKGLPYLAQLGYAYARIGDSARTGKILDELNELSGKRYVSPLDMAWVYAGLCEKDLAFAWLEKAYQERTARLIDLRDPALEILRTDPRFQDLVQRIGTSA